MLPVAVENSTKILIFVFLGILEKGIEMRCEETITVLQLLS